MWAMANLMMLLVTVGICLAQMVLWHSHLRDPLPAHFDGAGQVDGEMGKTEFYLLMGFVNGIFLIGIPLLGPAMKKIPNSMINLPNREYWLAPERRDKTLRTSSHFLIATGWISGWLMIGMFHLTAEVAIGIRRSINPEFYWVLGIYLVVLTLATVGLCLKFRKPARELSASIQQRT